MEIDRFEIVGFVWLSFFLLRPYCLFADGWQENPAMFNPSGVPSLSFSQPRFADLDGDGDQDLILGSITDKPFYLTNTGSVTSPKFSHVDDPFKNVSELDAEVGVFEDIDNDGDLDMIVGGFSGLNLYRNIGSLISPMFEIVTDYFPAFNNIRNPVPDLADIDNDGDADMVVGFSEDGSVKIYLNRGNDTLADFRAGDMTPIGDLGLYAYPVFCDLDHDGDFDIVAGKDGHGFTYYQNTGTADSFSYQANTSLFAGIGNDDYFNSPAIVDINGDGKEDLIFGTAAGPLNYFRNSGTATSPAWSKNSTLFGGVLDVGAASSPFFIDFDGDGDLDMITGSQLGDIKYIKNTGTSVTPAWAALTTFTALKHSIYSSVTMGDVNGDSLPDAIVGDLSGNLYYHLNTTSGFSSSFSTLSFATKGGWAVPRLIDLDHDDDLDIVAGDENGYLYYYENSGSKSSPAWNEVVNFFGGLDVGSNCVPALADLDHDGDYDLITGNISGDLLYFKHEGNTWVEDLLMFAGISGGQNTAPALADLDGDGDMDLTLGNYDGTFIYYKNTYPIVSVASDNIVHKSYRLVNYPNPFNPVTTIEYAIPTKSEVKVQIIDLNGCIIETLVDQYQEPGFYQVFWDASRFASGVYFYKIQAGYFNLTKKCLLIK